ncbi:alpha/beta fold hydrolase [Fictibacillus fluitans]|uniref:Alpha/beta hydrolase n=1 Tax=Fictibacillus fluitans TaxID=3058422 RepID=A0ABT8I3E6_9BACL|nr:alpha/beta hydrolase [Fictibacillus sp. NE201]MDN4527566.1 alpha/beta hydrolase [Fictibacillus sp. NE201]
MKVKTANLDTRKLAYVDEGKGETIVLIHGFCGSHEYWEDVIPELAKEYRVIAPDLNGHGKSSLSDSVCAVEDLSEDIKDLIGHLGLDQVTMLGHSLGGYITLAFADHQSNRLKGYGLIHSTAFPDDEAARKKRDSTIEEIKEKGIKSVIDQMVPNLFAPDTSLTEKIQKAKRIGYETASEGAIAAAIAMKNRPNRNDVLQNSKIPVLLVAGESDQVVPPEKTFSVAKENIIQATLKGAGHMGMYEARDALVEEINAFMKKIK